MIVALLLGTVPCYAEKPMENTVVEAKGLIDGILAYQGVSSSDGIQAWIDGYLTANAGVSAEWYILALSQYAEYDLSSYGAALLSYLGDSTVHSASSGLKYALCLSAAGGDDAYITSLLDSSVGEQGLMSWIFGLHLLNNGYRSGKYTTDEVKVKLLELQLNDGGWTVMGQYGDVDATAMSVQALAPYYDTDSNVKRAVDRALSLLSERQLDGGDFASYGLANPESTAQVMIALSALGIDASKDERFIKNGNTLFDGIIKYRLPDGSFCHKTGGASNGMATYQVFCAAVAYLRMSCGKPSLYLLDLRRADDDNTETETETDTEPEGSIETETNTDTEPDTDVGTDIGTETEADITDPDDTVLSPESTSNAGTDDEPIIGTRLPLGSEEEPTVDTPQATSPAETEDMPSDTGDDDRNDNRDSELGYKPWACLAVVCIGGAVCILLIILKKRHIKNFIAVLIAVSVALVFILSTDLRSADDYYNGESETKKDAFGTVTLTIRCDTVAGRTDHIPTDGIILDVTEFDIAEGDTVYTVLTEAARRYKIQLENNGDGTFVYISGMAYIYEFDYGDLSGWMYYVNGECPSVGAGEYVLRDGDVIEWKYTCALGEDLK